MRTTIATGIELLFTCARMALRGPPLYWAWLGALAAVAAVGAFAYAGQLEHGLGVTNMNDHVPWGAYIANFTYSVGLIDAAVILIAPALLFARDELRPLVYLGMFLALAGVILALLFVLVDIGHPERGWHLLPSLFGGWLAWPTSMLAWDVVVLNGWFVINLTLVAIFLFQRFRGHALPSADAGRLSLAPSMRQSRWRVALLFAMCWSIGLHVVTAFLYAWLSARPFWHSAVHAPRFLTSAFVAGPSFFVLSLEAMRRYASVTVTDAALESLRRILGLSMIANLFLLAAEVFTELFAGTAHSASSRYMFFGLHGHSMLVPYIWSALAMNLVACAIFIVPRLGRQKPLLLAGCLLAVVGVWIEKGMGMVVPGFIPGPLGEIREYTPSGTEILVCAGVWAVGLMVYTVLIKVGVPIAEGHVRSKRAPQVATATTTAAATAAATAAIVLLALGCNEAAVAPRGEADRTLDDLSLENVPARVAGRIDGEDFTVRDAFYRIERFAGRERVDLVLADRRDAACGLPVERSGRRVFVRFDGVTELETGTTRIDRSNDAASLHYEVPRDEGGYIGVGSGIALVGIDRVGRSSVRGRIDACFDDGRASCVRGAFRARFCASRLDGRLAREGTGLVERTPAAEAAP